MGDRSDRDGEMFGAFYIQEFQPNGQATNYLDPKFIVGCFDVDKQAVRLNKNFERTLSPSTIEQLKEKYKLTLQKTKERIDRAAIKPTSNEEINVSNSQNDVTPTYDSYDSFDFPEIEWDIPENTNGKTR